MRPVPSPTRQLRAALLRVMTALLATGALLAGALVSALPASAHNAIQSTDPADGASVPEAPDHVTLTFDAKVIDLGTAVGITSPDGADVADGEAVVDGNTVTQTLSGELPAGTYDVVWRVTSADGHPIDGEFSFTAEAAAGEVGGVGEAEESAPDAPDESPEPPTTAPEEPSAAPDTDSTSGTDATDAPDKSPAAADEDSSGANTIVIAIVVGVVLAGIWGVLVYARKRNQKRP